MQFLVKIIYEVTWLAVGVYNDGHEQQRYLDHIGIW